MFRLRGSLHSALAEVQRLLHDSAIDVLRLRLYDRGWKLLIRQLFVLHHVGLRDPPEIGDSGDLLYGFFEPHPQLLQLLPGLSRLAEAR